MNIVLKQLFIENFKGIKSLSIDFGNITNIYGENGLGKTSVFDAFTWLLFDKDSRENTKFNVKPLDENNEVIRGLSPTVTGVFDIDGKELKLVKEYSEKWTKKRGQSEAVFSGNETKFMINDAPALKKDYTAKIAEIIDDNVFKLLSNPAHFTSLHWEKQRDMLMELIGGFDDDKVFESSSNMRELKTLMGEKTADEFEAMIKSQISAAKKSKDQIPTRIDELQKSIVEDDFDAIEAEGKKLKSQIQKLDTQIADSSVVSNEDSTRKQAIQDTKLAMSEIKTKVSGAYNDKIQDIRDRQSEASKLERGLKSDVADIDNQISINNTKITTLETETQTLRELREQLNSEEFDESSTSCPTCKRLYDADKVDNIKADFEESIKARKLDCVNKGKANNKKVEDLNAQNDTLKSNKAEFAESLTKATVAVNEIDQELKAHESNSIQKQLDAHAEYQRHKTTLDQLESEVITPLDNPLAALKTQKQDLETKREELLQRYAQKKANENALSRIEELKTEESELANRISELEKQEFLTDEFITTKVGMLDEIINDKFDNVNFKMFERQVNGGIKKCCEATIEGVPYSDANSASKINAGLDIINAFSSYYSIQAPVFLDNRESTNRIIDTNSQVVNLIVTKDPELTVEVI